MHLKEGQGRKVKADKYTWPPELSGKEFCAGGESSLMLNFFEQAEPLLSWSTLKSLKDGLRDH